MMIQPIADLRQDLKSERQYDEIIFTTPDGTMFNQKIANNLSLKGNSRLGIGALAAAWTGFLAYHWLLSPRLLPLFVKIFQYLGYILDYFKKILKKVADFEK